MPSLQETTGPDGLRPRPIIFWLFVAHVFFGFLAAAISLILYFSSMRRKARQALASGALKAKLKFWDRRPFSRIVTNFRGFLKLRDNVRINQLDGAGFIREAARMMIEVEGTFYSRSD